jgi:hypothetical protein
LEESLSRFQSQQFPIEPLVSRASQQFLVEPLEPREFSGGVGIRHFLASIHSTALRLAPIRDFFFIVAVPKESPASLPRFPSMYHSSVKSLRANLTNSEKWQSMAGPGDKMAAN